MSKIERVSTPYTYSTAVAAGDYVFLGLHRGFGDTFSAQLEGAFEYLEETLAELGLTLESVVKIQVWLKHVEDLPEMEKRFAEYFQEGQYPARMTSTTAFIDDDCLLMLEGVAHRGADPEKAGGNTSMERDEMSSEPNGNGEEPRRGSMMALGIALGAGLGVALGTVFDNLAIGIAMGMGVGVTLGAALESRGSKKE